MLDKNTVLFFLSATEGYKAVAKLHSEIEKEEGLVRLDHLVALLSQLEQDGLVESEQISEAGISWAHWEIRLVRITEHGWYELDHPSVLTEETPPREISAWAIVCAILCFAVSAFLLYRIKRDDPAIGIFSPIFAILGLSLALLATMAVREWAALALLVWLLALGLTTPPMGLNTFGGSGLQHLNSALWASVGILAGAAINLIMASRRYHRERMAALARIKENTAATKSWEVK